MRKKYFVKNDVLCNEEACGKLYVAKIKEGICGLEVSKLFDFRSLVLGCFLKNTE